MKYKAIENTFKITNKKIIHIMKNGIIFSALLCIIAVLILSLYCSNSITNTFYIGISLFKSGLFYIIMFLICGIVFNKSIEK